MKGGLESPWGGGGVVTWRLTILEVPSNLDLDHSVIL